MADSQQEEESNNKNAVLEEERNELNIPNTQGASNFKGGYDYDLVDEEIKELNCFVCFLLIRNAVELGCGHSLCMLCLDSWEKRVNESGQAFECPSCKENIDRKNVKPNQTIDRIITSSIRVKCPQNPHGCQWINVISNVQDHLNKSCVYIIIPCTNVGCEEIVLKKDVDEHSRICGYRMTLCTDCHIEICFANIDSHEVECVKAIVQCPNNPCLEKMTRETANHHVTKECVYRPIECPFAEAGCRYPVNRTNYEQHQREYMEMHLALVMKELRAVKEDSRQQVTQLRNELDATKNEIASLRTELADQHRIDELGRNLRSSMDKIFISMKALGGKIHDDIVELNATIREKVISFDKSYALLEGRLGTFNLWIKKRVDEMADHFRGQVLQYTDLDMEQVFTDNIRKQTENNESATNSTVVFNDDLREKLRLTSYLNEHRELSGKLHFALANIQAALLQPTYTERYRGMLDFMEVNKKIRTENGYYVIKVQMLDIFEDEWNIVILKKQTMFTEYKNTKHQDLLINHYAKTISIYFLDEGAFLHDVPSVNVYSPRKMYKLMLPSVQRDDMRFRINFTTLSTSNLIQNGFLLLRIQEVPKMLVDTSFFTRSTTIS